MPGKTELTSYQALDRLLTRFTRLGWRDDGETRQALDAAYGSGGVIDASTLADQFVPTFLVNNDISREQLLAAIRAVVSGVTVLDPQAAGTPAVSNQTVNITNQGTWTGDVAGGDLAKKQTIKVMGDDVARLLAGNYQDDPEVRDIVDSTATTPDEKRSKLDALLVGVRGYTIELASSVITKLITSAH